MKDIGAPFRASEPRSYEKAARRRASAASGWLGLRLPRGRLAALASRGLLLRGRAALTRAATGAGLLASAARGARRVRDLRRALLRHAPVLQGLVLLLVLDVGGLARHREPPTARSFARSRRSACRGRRVRRRPGRGCRRASRPPRTPAGAEPDAPPSTAPLPRRSAADRP